MAGIWPGDTQCVVTLGFDIDGVSSWIGRNPDFANRPGLLSMAEYGPKRGVPRILKLLDDYDIKATFYIPGYVAENYEDMVREIVRKGHEVGHHGYMHEALGTMPLDQETEILERGMAILERLTGTKTLGYRAPFFDTSMDTIRLLAEHGFAYDTSMHDSDVPYIHEVRREEAGGSAGKVGAGRLRVLRVRATGGHEIGDAGPPERLRDLRR